MPNPKITVIIPTRERCDVLESSLRTVTSQDYDNLDIIVSDNFSNDDTRGVVERANDKRIRYLNTGKRLSMSHNWEFALSKVTQGWVTILGDDDGLMPGSLGKIAELIQEYNVKAIRSRVCNYLWPAAANRPWGQLIVPVDNGVEVRHGEDWLQKVMAGLYAYNELPILYSGGFAAVRLVEEIRNRSGCFYQSCTPDVYSAIALASSLDSYLYLREPLAITGTSAHSNGRSFYYRGANRNPNPALTYSAENNIPFHRDIPMMADGSYPLSIQALVFESYLQTLHLRPGRPIWSHKHQLEIIIASSGNYRDSIDAWAKRFAEQHSLDHAAAHQRARLLRPYISTRKIITKVSRALRCVVAGSSTLAISDVFDASIAAAVIRSRPGRLNTLVRILKTLANGTNPDSEPLD